MIHIRFFLLTSARAISLRRIFAISTMENSENSKLYTRQEVLRLVGLGIPGLLMSISALTSCSKFPLPDKNFSGTVGIVGGGIAGLYAGYMLQQQGISVMIYEASDRKGGRIRSQSDLIDHPVEWGAHRIWGENHALFQLLTANGVEWVDQAIQDYAYVEGFWLSEAIMDDQQSVKKLNSIIDGLKTYEGADMSANLYATIKGLPASTQPIWNARLGIKNGATTDIMGIEGIASSIQNASSGTNERLVRSGDLESLILSTFRDVPITYSTPIVDVDYSGSKVVLTDTNGVEWKHDKVLVTAPIPILKNNIQFYPTLPSKAQAAIDGTSMRGGLQVLLTFNQRFWPGDAKRLQMDGLCPNFEVIGSGGRSNQNLNLMANLFGTAYETALEGPMPIVPALLQQLDTYYGDNIATNSWVNSESYDWGQDPWIQGTQSYSPVGGSEVRYGFAESVNQKLYWAGEATHTDGHHGTIHGAMETAVRAVQQILEEA
jgi:monoamine oxidase